MNPHDIPNGYCEKKHAALSDTIADGFNFGAVLGTSPLKIMACHETHEAHCVGWLVNQIGPGNNIALRISLMRCPNLGKVKTIGPQHETFADTFPRPPAARRPTPRDIGAK